MKQSLLDHELVRLEAYEPAGTSVDLSARDLLGHTLVLGGSGAGKTTCVIQPIVSQLIQSRSQLKSSVCILDTKADGEAFGFIQAAAFAAERESDIAVVSVSSDFCLNLLGPLLEEGLEGAVKLAETLRYLIPECATNRYWEATFGSLLAHTLKLFLLLGHELEYSRFVTFIADYLLRFDSDEGSFRNLDQHLESQLEDGVIDAPVEAVHEARSMHRMWERLDWRTRSNLQSMTAPLVGLLNTNAAKQLFSEGEPISIRQAIENGGIILLSADSIRQPEVARLAGTLLKARYYDAIFRRCATEQNPLSVLVLDDWIQSANQGAGSRYADVDALALIRSRHACILAAAQGLAGLDLAIGPYSRKAVLANFGNLFFFRSRDTELDAIASAYLGQTTQTLKDTAHFERISANQRRSMPIEYHREIPVPAVPPGALARLPTGEAYVLIGGKSYNQPISFIPHYTSK